MTGTRGWTILALVVFAMAFVIPRSAGITDDNGKVRRVVPVTNVVQTGAQPIKGDVVKVEVIDAVDLTPSKSPSQFKVAVRVRSARAARVRCSLKLMFDGDAMGQPSSIDLLSGQSDLLVFSCYCGEGKGADQLAKLTAEASNIRLGE